MDEKVKKKGSKVDGGNSGSSFELEPNKGKKKKHKEGKKRHGTDEILNLSEAAERQTCSIEGNREEERHVNKKKKKKERKVINSNVADGKEMQLLDDNQQSKMKKRKERDDPLAEIQEMEASKPSKKGKMTGDNEFKSNEGDLPLVKNNEGEDDDQGKKMKKKKLSEKSKLKDNNKFKNNEGDLPLVTNNEGEDDDQGKKMKKKKLSEKSKLKDNNKFKNNEGDLPLVKNNEGEDDDQVKKMKKKKKSEKSKLKDNNEIKSNEGDLPLVTNNEGEDDDQGKKMKKKKLSEKSKLKDNNEFKINECDQDLAKSNLAEDNDQGKEMKKKELSGKRKSKESNDFNEHCIATEADDQGKKMKVKKKTKASTTESPSPAPAGTSKPKRVTFSDQVEVCFDDNVVRGKRFTPEEDETIKEAVFSYIKCHGLGDEGLDMILHCRSHPEVKDCWKEIAAALPHRHHNSVYNRAHILFERDEKRKWTPDELEFIKKVQEQHGSDWKSIAEALGKSQFHVKDAWRRIKLATAKTGHWTQEEYQNLFDLVNLDLRVRASEESKQSRHGMLRDNISWEAIAGKLETRTSQRCCKKWYEQITSPMVADNIWSDTDDYRLVNALFTLDACCFEEVDWDNLLEHRPGDVCRKRWNEMVRHIGEHVGKSFADHVEILAKRFCPDLLEAREAFDSKPVLD